MSAEQQRLEHSFILRQKGEGVFLEVLDMPSESFRVLMNEEAAPGPCLENPEDERHLWQAEGGGRRQLMAPSALGGQELMSFEG